VKHFYHINRQLTTGEKRWNVTGTTMKQLTISGAVLRLYSQRFCPRGLPFWPPMPSRPSGHLARLATTDRPYRPFINYQEIVQKDDPDTGQAIVYIAWTLKDGSGWQYTSPPMSHDEASFQRGLLLREPDPTDGSYSGGEYYNFNFRASCGSKDPI
jgi:hypothetical protein